MRILCLPQEKDIQKNGGTNTSVDVPSLHPSRSPATLRFVSLPCLPDGHRLSTTSLQLCPPSPTLVRPHGSGLAKKQKERTRRLSTHRTNGETSRARSTSWSRRASRLRSFIRTRRGSACTCARKDPMGRGTRAPPPVVIDTERSRHTHAVGRSVGRFAWTTQRLSEREGLCRVCIAPTREESNSTLYQSVLCLVSPV